MSGPDYWHATHLVQEFKKTRDVAPIVKVLQARQTSLEVVREALAQSDRDSAIFKALFSFAQSEYNKTPQSNGTYWVMVDAPALTVQPGGDTSKLQPDIGRTK